MIEYAKSSVRIAELHYDEPPASAIHADVVRYQWRLRKVPGTVSFPLYTRVIDLAQDPDQILSQMNTNARRLVRKGLKTSTPAEFDATPSLAMFEEFEAFHRAFARAKNLPHSNRARLESMRAEGCLCLSRAKAADGETLVWHCYFRNRGWARLMYSASIYRLEHSKEQEAEIACANRSLHFHDMLALRDLGDTTYDLGGWYTGSEDQAKLRINYFKEGFGGRVVELHNTYDGRTMKGLLAVQLHRWKGGE